jgi:proline-specific peptidase
MSELYPAREGFASFRGLRTRFRVIGSNRSRRPLLCIHGGPGLGSNYLDPLQELLATGRQVVFYEQQGCDALQSSDSPDEWSLALFLEELAAVRAATGLLRCHILGHGWGGMLALEYALTQAAGIESLVLSSTVASVPQWRRELAQLVASLPPEIRAPLRAHAEAGTLASAACDCHVEAFRRRHLCRMNPWPAALERSQACLRAHPEARSALLGPSELEPAGQLADWDLTARLDEIARPTLVVSGRYDLVSPAAAATLYRGIAGSEWVVFEQSAHVPHLEEPQRYLEVLDGFLARAEAARRRRAPKVVS